MIFQCAKKMRQIVFSHAGLALGGLCAVMLLTAGCSDKSLDKSSLLNQLADETNFAEFCQSWGLTCPTGTPANFPDEKNSYTVQQWQALSSIGAALLGSGNELTMTRDELEADTLKHAVNELGANPLYDQLIKRIQTLGWREGGIGGGNIRAVFDAATAFTGKSGAKYNFADTLLIGLDPQATLKFTGMKIASASGADSQALESINVTGANVARLDLDPLKVQSVPLAFLKDEALTGIDLESMKKMDIGMPKLVRAMRPLFDWMNQPGRNVTLGEDFFGVVRNKVPEWIVSPSAKEALYPITQALASLAIHLGSTEENLFAVGQAKNAKLVCDMTQGSQKITMKFDASFGLKSYEPLGDDSVKIELFGIKATVASAMGMTITLGRIDITPEKIIIYNVPILGSYEVKIDDQKKPDEKSSFVCKK